MPSQSKKRVNILGVTGSVGQTAANIITAHKDRFEVGVITGGKNVKQLAEMAKILDASIAVIADEGLEEELIKLLSGTSIQASAGEQAICEHATHKADITIAAIVGMAGLKPLMAALEGSRAVALANKEPLVAAGSLVLAHADKHRTKILPIDSEHNAIFQVFYPSHKESIERIILTASGGPFSKTPVEQMANVSVKEALAHPTWTMGRKISIDSATLMNKALEIIEAHFLFDMPPEKIDVVIHPQSIVHSMVEYADGSILAQMGASDMHTPVTYALGWPDRLKTPGETLDLTKLSSLEFHEPDTKKFPAIRLAYECLKKGQEACITLNAANEVAVESFLTEQIDFLTIVEIIEYCLSKVGTASLETLDSVIEYDKAVRRLALDYIDQLSETRKVVSRS